MYRFVFCLVVVLIGTVRVDGSVALAEERVCETDPDTLTYKCTIVRRAAPGGEPITTTVGELPIVWERRLSTGLPGATFGCYYEVVDGTTTTEVNGVGWAVFVTNTETGITSFASFVCEYPGEDPPEPPPPPPGIDRFVEAQRRVLALETGLNPSAERRGVSQLATWFWCDGPQSTVLTLTLDGYEIAAEVGVQQVVWEIDGPDGVIERSAPGCGAAQSVDSSGGDAAATWTPNEPGASLIVLTTSWAGTWELTYSDPTLGTVNLGVFDLEALDVVSEPILYEVYEIQSVGVGP